MAILHVNSNVIRSNRKKKERNPVLSYRKTPAAKVELAQEITLLIEGKQVGRLVYRPDAPLPCGATVWIEWSGEVKLSQEKP